jgi:hypothetical protein
MPRCFVPVPSGVPRFPAFPSVPHLRNFSTRAPSAARPAAPPPVNVPEVERP